MTTPGGFYPDDAITDGDLSSLDGLDQATWRAGLNDQVIAPFHQANDNLLGQIGQALDSVWQAITDALSALGAAAASVIDGLVSGFVALVDNIAAALGFGGAADANEFGQGTLADIRDGQRALVGRIDALSDNAGFINLCMGHNWYVQGSYIRYAVTFDKYVTAHKNAHVGKSDWFGGNRSSTEPGVGPIGIVFDAPGVWDIESVFTLDSNNTNSDYFEHDIHVCRMWFKKYDSSGMPIYSHYGGEEGYSNTRFADATYDDLNRIKTAFATKRVVIPDDGNTYGALVGVLFQKNRGYRKIWGGNLWTSFSATRQSTDTTVYNPPSQVSDGNSA